MWHSSASATDKGMRAVAYIVRWLVYRKGNRCRQVAPMCSPKYALFLEPAWVSRLNGISIGLAVCTAHSLSPWTDRTMICTRSICVTMPYFVKIGRTVAVVPRWLFIYLWHFFQNGGRPPYWICVRMCLDHPRIVFCGVYHYAKLGRPTVVVVSIICKF